MFICQTPLPPEPRRWRGFSDWPLPGTRTTLTALCPGKAFEYKDLSVFLGTWGEKSMSHNFFLFVADNNEDKIN